MTAMELSDMQDLLVRIDERVKSIQEAIQEINTARACAAHQVKIKFLERMMWGCMAGMAGLGLRAVFEALKS